MDSLLGLASLAGLSLFFARLLRRSASLMPLVAVSAGMLWFTLFGIAGLLPLGGWLWFGGCAAALAYTLVKEKAAVLHRITPGWLGFTLGGALFIVLFFATRPMLTQWDEFTFWGAAGRAVTNTGQLYTTAPVNLIARTYPPGLIMLSYLLQFFGGSFAEWKFIAAYALVYLAAFAAASALWEKHRSSAVAALAGMFLLPLLFEVNHPAGQLSWAYLATMADWPMAAMFGGALCLYFGANAPAKVLAQPAASGNAAAPRRDGPLLLAFGLVLAALTNLKDMGLALALIVWFIALADMLFFQLEELTFFGLKRVKALIAGGFTGLLCIAGTYLAWFGHMQAALTENRFNIGSGGSSLSQFEMLAAGVKALFGIQRTHQFDVVSKLMWDALFTRDVSLVGSGSRLMGIIFVVLGIAWMLSGTKKQRRRVLVFSLLSTLCFVAFYIFNIFTYSFVISEVEAFLLKDYHRYIGPYWFGWLMASTVLLAEAVLCEGGVRPLRAEVRALWARVAMAGFTVCVAVVVAFYSNWRGNFLTISPSLYSQRLSVQGVVNTALGEGMQKDDIVYMVSQGDDGGRFYMFSYELDAKLSLLMGDTAPDANGKIPGTTASAFVAPGTEYTIYQFPVEATPKDLGRFLQQQGCTHLMLDMADDYFVEVFGPKFTDKLEGWAPDGAYAGGHRYFAIEWRGSDYRLVPAEEAVRNG